MKTLQIVLWTIAVLVVILVSAYTYYGGFVTISPEIKEVGGETLVYEKITGDYSQSSAISDRVYQKLLEDHQIATTKGFGIYYDNPKVTEKDKLRADIGCILESDLDKMEALKKDFEVMEYPKDKYLVAEFPFKGMPSVLIGIRRVYPTLNVYAEQKGYAMDTPVMEIWDVPNKKIKYRKALVKIEKI
ncbi:GyrI-like domain-containing protein [Ulvibacterium sp.]|uniref:GyrI-like domain-containing protein n=1 Tax=Ulvibacterium sp. TaxID=2665914 RepID=UPI003BAC5935